MAVAPPRLSCVVGGVGRVEGFTENAMCKMDIIEREKWDSGVGRSIVEVVIIGIQVEVSMVGESKGIFFLLCSEFFSILAHPLKKVPSRGKCNS